MDNTKRFTDRVENYVRYRPGYPLEIISYLEQKINFNQGTIIADIGSGTGISTELFLKNGNNVFAVEPNDAMRLKAEELLVSYPGFSSVNGSAESTTLKDHSIDMILAGQAFHWFDQKKTRAEFKRIGTKEAYIVLMWNIRETESPFSKEYEDLLLGFGTDYKDVGHKEIASEEKLSAFFAPHQVETAVFENKQLLDYESLKGRLLSSSYIPNQQDKNYKPMLASLESLFNRYAAEGKISFDYSTKLYTGRAN